MKRWSQRAAAAVLAAALMYPAVGAAADGQHWVDKETAPYKQLLVPARDKASAMGPVTQEEWNTFHQEVLNAEQYDQPIDIQNWATLLKLTIRLPKEEMDRLLDMYVYGFDQQGRIMREDAVGGMVKLLSMETIRAVWTSGDPQASDTIQDTKQVSERQLGLLNIAYKEGLLDSGVKEQFRPGEWLTNAEAISMGYKIASKYGVPADVQPVPWPSGHWSTGELQAFQGYKESKIRVHRVNQAFYQTIPLQQELDQPIAPEAWHRLVIGIGPVDSDFARSYTTMLNPGTTVERSKAVVALMKLYGELRNASDAEKEATLKKFSDAGEAFDLSKLALADGMGLLAGDEDGKFNPKRALTVAEAYVLAARMGLVLAKGDPY